MAKNSIENGAHFAVGHFCGGCPVANKLHTGCVVGSDVRIYPVKSYSSVKSAPEKSTSPPPATVNPVK